MDDAIEDFTQLTVIAPDDPRGFQLRGNAYMRIGRAELALQDYNRALELDSQNGLAYAGRAYAYTLLREFRRAMNDYEPAIHFGVPQAEKMQEEAERPFIMQSIQQLASLSEPGGLNALADSFPFVTSPEYLMMLNSYVGHLPQEERTALAERLRWLERQIADQ